LKSTTALPCTSSAAAVILLVGALDWRPMAEPARPVDSNRGQKGPPSRRCSTCGASYPVDFLVCPKDATSLEVKADGDADPLIGEVLAGSFCVTGVLGSGGMGRVYEAEHVRLPRRFAVKVMHGELAGHVEAMARFEREAQAVAQVVSEHVVEVVDVVRSRDGRPCIVTELLQGEELGALLDRSGKLPLPTTIKFAARSAAASPPPTRSVSCTAISSPRTSSWSSAPAAACTSRSSISASPR
jgi:Protein kinase domain